MISNDLFTGIIPVAFVNHKNVDSPTILIVNSKGDGIFSNHLQQNVKQYSIKSKTVSDSGTKTTYEVQLNESSTRFISTIKKLASIRNVTLVSYYGDYLS